MVDPVIKLDQLLRSSSAVEWMHAQSYARDLVQKVVDELRDVKGLRRCDACSKLAVVREYREYLDELECYKCGVVGKPDPVVCNTMGCRLLRCTACGAERSYPRPPSDDDVFICGECGTGEVPDGQE